MKLPYKSTQTLQVQSFKIELDAIPGENVSIQIIDVQGIEVFMKAYADVKAAFMEEVHLQDLPKGIYFIKVGWADEVYLEKIVMY